MSTESYKEIRKLPSLNKTSLLITCYLCGKSFPYASLETEHVIPKSLGKFTNPVTLKACKQCNDHKAKKDIRLIRHLQLVGNDEAFPMFENGLRGWSKGKDAHILADIISQIDPTPISVKTPGGIFLGETRAIRVSDELRKLADEVFEQWARGLWIRNSLKPMASGEYRARVIWDTNQQGESVVQKILSNLRGKIKPEYGQLWPKRFEYFGILNQKGAGSVWLMRIYGLIDVVVLFEAEAPTS